MKIINKRIPNVIEYGAKSVANNYGDLELEDLLEGKYEKLKNRFAIEEITTECQMLPSTQMDYYRVLEHNGIPYLIMCDNKYLLEKVK